MPDEQHRLWGRVRQAQRQVQSWSRRYLPPGVRLIAGLILMVAGIFGFLPVFGFWMFPLGVAVAALDIGPIWRWLRGRREGPRKPGGS